MEKKRIEWVDVAKGYGILLVLLGHLQMPEIQVSIYSFHMPLFFFLSGVVFSTKTSFKEFVKGKIRRIVLPYFCLGIPLVLAHIFFMEDLSYRNDLIPQLLRLVLQKRYLTIWFLACLLMLNCYSYPIARWCPNKRIGWGIAFLMGVIGLVLWRNNLYISYWNADISLVVMPFFYGGYCLRDTLSEDEIFKHCSRRWVAALALLIGAMTVVLSMANMALAGVMVDLYHSWFRIEGISHIVAVLGILMTVMLSMRWKLAFVRYVGNYSLIYFAWHQFMVMPMLRWCSLALGIFHVEQEMDPIAIQILFLILMLVILTLVNEVVMRTPLRRIFS